MKSFIKICFIAAVAIAITGFMGTGVHAAPDEGLVPPMRPSTHLCTGYPTTPPTHTPTPTPQPTPTPVSDFIDSNLCAADSYVSAHSPSMNFGDSQVLTMRKNEYYIYMRFFLRELDTDASIVHTFLRLTPFQIPPVSSTVKIYATSNDWQESTITYENRPASQGQVGSLYVWTSTNPIEINITDVIREAYDQGINEVSFIAAYESSYFDLNIESQETARPPVLKIYYNSAGMPSPTPTGEPTSGPGKLTTDISLNKTMFHACDPFILTARFGNQQPYPVNAGLWVVLDAGGAMWFWPEWGTSPSWQNATFISGEEKILTPLQFEWPAVSGTASGMKFWSVILDELHTDIAIDNVTFGWE